MADSAGFRKRGFFLPLMNCSNSHMKRLVTLDDARMQRKSQITNTKSMHKLCTNSIRKHHIELVIHANLQIRPQDKKRPKNHVRSIFRTAPRPLAESPLNSIRAWDKTMALALGGFRSQLRDLRKEDRLTVGLTSPPRDFCTNGVEIDLAGLGGV